MGFGMWAASPAARNGRDYMRPEPSGPVNARRQLLDDRLHLSAVRIVTRIARPVRVAFTPACSCKEFTASIAASWRTGTRASERRHTRQYGHAPFRARVDGALAVLPHLLHAYRHRHAASPL